MRCAFFFFSRPSLAHLLACERRALWPQGAVILQFLFTWTNSIGHGAGEERKQGFFLFLPYLSSECNYLAFFFLCKIAVPAALLNLTLIKKVSQGHQFMSRPARWSLQRVASCHTCEVPAQTQLVWSSNWFLNIFRVGEVRGMPAGTSLHVSMEAVTFVSARSWRSLHRQLASFWNSSSLEPQISWHVPRR